VQPPRPDPAVAATRVAVRRSLADLEAGALVLVACSGGPDSLALAAATAFVARRAGLRAGAVVVDHRLQPGSAEVAASAAGQCADLGLDPAEVVAVDVVGQGGPEASARAARYRALDAAAQHHGAGAVLLAHTLDDQAEQVLLGLARGSGGRSLAGMPASREGYRRPFLQVERSVVQRCLAALDLHAWQDPSNADVSLTRSRVRHRVLPVLEAELGPGVARALARTADQLREDAEVLEALAAQVLADSSTAQGLDVRTLCQQPAALRRRTLRLALLRAGAPAGSLSRAHVLAVDALLTRWRGQGAVHLPGGVRARRASGMLVLVTIPSR